MKLISFLISAILLFTAFPVKALPAAKDAADVPGGYNENDYSRCLAFLEQVDENGVKNGVKLDPSYDPNDPHSWGSYTDDNGTKRDCFTFASEGGELRLAEVKADESDLVGTLDLSGCTALTLVNCLRNRITAISVEGCTALVYLSFLQNRVSSIDVTTNPNLRNLGTADNPIAELDLSNNPQLHNLFVGGGAMRELDLTANPLLPMERIYAAGNGAVGYMYLDLGFTEVLGLFPLPFSGAEFEGWFTEDGVFENNDPEVYYIEDPWSHDVLQARFAGGQPAFGMGDVNLSGEVDVGDALMALRHAMGLIALGSEQITLGDIDGNGDISVNDALMILRMAMGLA